MGRTLLRIAARLVIVVAAFGLGHLAARALRGWDAYHAGSAEYTGLGGSACRVVVEELLDEGPPIAEEARGTQGEDEPVRFRVRILSGKLGGKRLEGVQSAGEARRHGRVRAGERRLAVVRPSDGGWTVRVASQEREGWLLGLAASLVACLALTGGRKGLAAAGSVAWALVLLLFVLLPAARHGAALAGWSMPLAVGIAVPTLLAIGGWNRKSAGAILGTLCGVLAGGLMGLGFIAAMALSGLDVEFGAYPHLDSLLWFSSALGRVDFTGLLVTSMVLAGLGAVMDVSMAVASTVAEVRGAAPEAGARVWARQGLAAGRDILGIMVFTLGMVLLGSHLLFLVSIEHTGWVRRWIHLANYEELATELARMAAIAVGMALCGPASALATALLHRRAPAARHPEPAARVRRARRGRLRATLWPVAALTACVAAAGLTDEWGLRAYRTDADGGAEHTVARVVSADPPVLALSARSRDPRDRSYFRSQVAVVQPFFGPRAGEVLAARQLLGSNPASHLPLRKGAAVHASLEKTPEGGLDVLLHKPPLRYRWGLVAALVVVAVLAVAGGRVGLRVLGVVVAVVGLLLGVLVPALSAGAPPLPTAGAACLLMLTAASAISGAVDRKAASGMLGAAAGLGIAAALLGVSGWRLDFRGLDSVTAEFLSWAAGKRGAAYNFTGLLHAALLLALFGLVLDTAVTIASGVAQVCSAQPALPRLGAAAAGMNIARDVVGTMVLTLVFAFVGLRLHVFLLPAALGVSPAELVNREAGATAILHLLIGALALTVTGPATALIAAALLARGPARERRLAQRVRPRRWPLAVAAALALAGVVGVAHWQRLRAERRQVARTPTLPAERDAALASAGRALRAGRTGKALLTLWRARSRHPQDPAVRTALAEAYAKNQWIGQARREVDTALDLGADDAQTHYVAGVVCAWTEQYERAEKHLRRALRRNPSHAAARAALERLFGP